jgi:hypothetical protein
MIRSIFLLFFLCNSLGSLLAQGTLQFNQVIVVNSNSGTLTVPVGKVWKVTGQGMSRGVYYENYSSNLSPTWSATNPNPCTGATSGSGSNLRYVRKYLCPTANNGIMINGDRINLSGGSLWLSSGTSLQITGTPCVNTLTPNIAASTPYYVYETTTGSNVYYWECLGAVNAGVVGNSTVASVIEFNVIP